MGAALDVSLNYCLCLPPTTIRIGRCTGINNRALLLLFVLSEQGAYLCKRPLSYDLAKAVKVQAAASATLQVEHQPPEVQPLLIFGRKEFSRVECHCRKLGFRDDRHNISNIIFHSIDKSSKL